MTRRQLQAARLFLAALLIAVGASACVTPEVQTFRVSKSAVVESAQISTSADFSKFSRLYAEDMGIFFPQGSPSTPEDIQRIRQIFRNAFVSELTDYEIVEERGPGTMAVQASVIDLRYSEGGKIAGLRREVREIATPGSIVFLMEMKDSSSGAVLARAADSASAPQLATASGSGTDWASMQQAAENWAVLFRLFLDENFGR